MFTYVSRWVCDGQDGAVNIIGPNATRTQHYLFVTTHIISPSGAATRLHCLLINSSLAFNCSSHMTCQISESRDNRVWLTFLERSRVILSDNTSFLSKQIQSMFLMVGMNNRGKFSSPKWVLCSFPPLGLAASRRKLEILTLESKRSQLQNQVFSHFILELIHGGTEPCFLQ